MPSMRSRLRSAWPTRPVFWLLLLLLTACAPVAQFERVDADQIRVVGWVAEVDPHFHNVHTGITVFGNFSQPLQNDWNFEAQLQQAASAALARSGRALQPIALTAEELALVNTGQCYSFWNVTYDQAACGPAIAELLARHQVDALLYVWNYPVSLDEVSLLPGVGAFSRGSDRPGYLVAVASIGMVLYSGNPAQPGHTGRGCLLGANRAGHPWSKDVGDMSIEDWAFLRPELELLLARTIEKRLFNAGLLGGSEPACPEELPAMEKL